MLSDKDFSELFKELRKKRYTIHQEISLYNAIKELSEKYKKKFFDWYVEYEKEHHKYLPEIIEPKNEIERDVKRLNQIIHSSKQYTTEEVLEYEKMICDYLASDITRYDKYHHNDIGCSTDYMKLKSFLNRYEQYRPFYMVRFQLKYEEN